MNHANQPENLSYFHFNVRSLGKNKHKLDDFFLMTEVTPTVIAISETMLKPSFIVLKILTSLASSLFISLTNQFRSGWSLH